MEASEEQGGQPEVTVETVPDHIETGYSDGEPGILDFVKYFLLNYFSNPWALLILAYLTYKLYRHLKPFVTEPITERFSAWKERRELQEEDAKYKKNPDEYRSKMEAMEAARIRLQQR